ncbi:MAG: hypothetical protein ICV80_21550 [Microcoleus sp. T1-bin1]|nr:hypothetical protein [Microcoleus sp. T1-bin1]
MKKRSPVLEDDRTTVKASRLQVSYCPNKLSITSEHHLPAAIGLAGCCCQRRREEIVSG